MDWAGGGGGKGKVGIGMEWVRNGIEGNPSIFVPIVGTNWEILI